MSEEREKKSMEQHAREHRDDMVRSVGLFGQLQDASDSDDIEPDDWQAIVDEYDVTADCDNCGKPFTDHVVSDEPGDVADRPQCPGEGEADGFYIRDLSSLVEEARERIDGWNYGAGISMTVDVTLYGGGPAGGIEFDCDRGRHGLEMLGARVWHQDWFEPKGWAPLDDDVASRLWDLWGLDYLLEAEG